jgi:hypothetical protein
MCLVGKRGKDDFIFKSNKIKNTAKNIRKYFTLLMKDYSYLSGTCMHNILVLKVS